MKYNQLIVSALLFIISSCTKDNKETEQKYNTIINPNTIVVNDTTNNSIVEVTENTIVFEGNPNQADKFIKNNIVVSGITDKAPNGYLRKIVSVFRNGSRTIIYTENATLEEAIQECEVDFGKILSTDDTLKRINGTSFGTQINAILYDEDNDLSSKDDQIKLSGSVNFNPSIIANLKIKNFSLQYLKLGAELEEDLDLSLVANLYSNKLLEGENQVVKYPMGMYVIPVGGVFPIVVQPFLIIKAGHRTGLNGKVSAGWKGNSTQTSYVEYKINEGYKDYYDYQLIPTHTYNSIEGSISSEAYLKAEVAFALYDFEDISAGVNAKAYINAKGTCSITPSGFDDCDWKVKAGVKSAMDVKAKVFGKNLFDYSVDLFDYNKIIYEYNPIQSGKITFPLDEVSTTFTSLNDCYVNGYDSYGSSHTMYIDVDDVFSLNQDFEIKAVGYFSSGIIDIDYLNNYSFAVSVEDYNTIKINWCTIFTDSEYFDFEITVLNDNYQSEPRTIRVYRPNGANITNGIPKNSS